MRVFDHHSLSIRGVLAAGACVPMVLLLGACGSSDGNGADGNGADGNGADGNGADGYGASSETTEAESTQQSTQDGSDRSEAAAGTITAETIDGMEGVLVGPDGMTLYVVEEFDGDFLCVEACTDVWPPVLTEGSSPEPAKGVEGEFGTIERPDGTTQVTLGGRPLYTYASGTEGSASGEGITGGSGENTFTWRVAGTVEGAAGATPESTTTEPGSDSGSGGVYGY